MSRRQLLRAALLVGGVALLAACAEEPPPMPPAAAVQPAPRPVERMYVVVQRGQSLQEIAANSKPTVVVGYGAANSIQVASTARFPGMNINAATFGALLGFGKRNGTIVPQNP